MSQLAESNQRLQQRPDDMAIIVLKKQHEEETDSFINTVAEERDILHAFRGGEGEKNKLR